MGSLVGRRIRERQRPPTYSKRTLQSGQYRCGAAWSEAQEPVENEMLER